jgi:hypothetical protein
VSGRPIGPGDDANGIPVAVVNESFVQQTWIGRPAIGKAITVNPPGADAPQSFEIVGVVANAKEKDLLGPASPVVYFSDRQASFPHVVLAVRGRGGAPVPMGPIRAELRAIDPSLALDDVSPLETKVRSSYALPFFLLNILSAFAFSAAILIGVGVYGSASYAVGADIKGIGVRMALGATRRRILLSVLSRTAAWAIPGCLAGLAMSAAVAKVAGTIGVRAEPAMTVAGAAAALLLALGAAFLPAWRAGRTDPLAVLRG